jgi:hypothetical protein
VNPESPADEADVLEQQRDVREADVEAEEPPSADVEADSADVHEQSLPVPSASEEEDWPDG